MIAATVEELTPLIGTRPACRALGASPATIYRRRRPPAPRAPRPRPAPQRALTEPERERVLEVLHCERFVDVSPEETYATLLDEGTYLCSTRTMYRILAAHHGGVRERRAQLTHPPYAKPELLAERPNELWSWDVSKLKGPAKWTYYYLYVILDVFSRYIVGWTVQYRENAQLAAALIEQASRAAADHPEDPDVARRSRRAAARQAGRVPPRRSRDHQDPLAAVHLQRQPLLGGELQDAEVPARVPRPLRHHRARPQPLPRVRRLVQPCPPPLRDRADDPSRRPPRHRAGAARRPSRRPRRRLRPAPRAIRPQATGPAGAADSRLDQQASRHEAGRRSLNSNTKRLTGLDRLRSPRAQSV